MKVTVVSEALIIKVVPADHITPREFLLSRKEVDGKFEYDVVSIDLFCGERMLGREHAPSFFKSVARAVGITAAENAGEALWKHLCKELSE